MNVKFGIIVDVEAFRAIRQAEVGGAETMIEQTEERWRQSVGLDMGASCAARLFGTLRHSYTNSFCGELCVPDLRSGWAEAITSRAIFIFATRNLLSFNPTGPSRCFVY